jgi:hypothetical protein
VNGDVTPRVRGTTTTRQTEMRKTRTAPRRPPEEQAEIDAIRERSRTERPGPDELIDRGEIDKPVPHEQYVELRALTARLRAAREAKGLSLTDLSERTGLIRAAISRRLRPNPPLASSNAEHFMYIQL